MKRNLHTAPYLVETLAITGKWVPKDGEHVLHTLFSASVETFETRLQGKRSRIVHFKTGDVVVTVPPKADYLTPREPRHLLALLQHKLQEQDHA